jgi:sialate O-acetylesterase
MKSRSSMVVVLVGLFSVLTGVQAGELGFGRFYTDNMVLQRDKPVVIRGTAPENAQVTVAFDGRVKTATADKGGQWSVALDAMPAASQPKTLSVATSGKMVTLKNIVVGDVILFGRQTTIDLALGRDAAGKKAAAALQPNPLFRAISVKTLPAAKPQQDLAPEATQGWSEVTAEVALKMSAAAFYLGRDLAPEVKVPVGIIDLNMGSAFPLSWLSREALEETEKFYGKGDIPGQLKMFDSLLEEAASGTLGTKKKKGSVVDGNVVEYPLFPSGGYNAVLNPIQGVALKAVLVQLGNDYPYMIYDQVEKKGLTPDRVALNRAYVQTYDIQKVGFRSEPVTTPRIPREWRKMFGDADLPVGLVLPPGSSLNVLGMHNREMRELNRLTAVENKNVGVIMPGSQHIPKSGQPADEQVLGERSRNWVLGAVYKKDGMSATGPLFDKIETAMNNATVFFKEGTAKGLKASKGALDVFEVAGIEGDYAPAQARIDGEVIRLKSEQVTRIAHVRYNWQQVPDQGLVNAAGLPAIPFRSEKAEYNWFVRNEETDLPIEYSTPANEWKGGDVTLVNGQLKTHGYKNFTGWLGPIGVRVGPFGPNMGVRQVVPGSPGHNKLFEGDVIYSANGKMLGETAWVVMGDAITFSESDAGKGKLSLGVRRAGKNMDVDITLEVMGTFSPTAPYDCPKTEKMIDNLEKWVEKHGGAAGFLNTDALFLLGTGNPKYQGLVRRIVYAKMAGVDINQPIEPTKAGKSWHNSAEALLLGEYYLATGDKNVLPHLLFYCKRLSLTQHPFGGWRHNFPGGENYGLMPNAGLPGGMGMCFAKQAGLKIDEYSFQLALKYFLENRAQTGYLIYGLGACNRLVPVPIDPALMATGKLHTYNGGLSAAGILAGLTGDARAAHLCSLISTYSYDNTFDGHGGNFWNNFWTPLGAHAHSKAAYIHFWKGHRWYRECNRMFDGSLIMNEGCSLGAGPGLALVAPRRRLQIVGAPKSPFAVDAPEYLKPAVAAYQAKDYAGCEKLVNELLAAGTVGKDDRPRVEFLARAAKEIQESIASDMSRVEGLIKAGKLSEAGLDVVQLKGIVSAGQERLAAIEKALAVSGAAQKKGTGKKVAEEGDAVEAQLLRQKEKAVDDRKWECLVTEMATDKSKAGAGKGPEAQASKWRLMVVESMDQAPAEWTTPGFDDKDWTQTTLPISWRMYHTALLRTTFNVADKKAFDGLRFRAWLFRQQGIEIYLNGKLIGKVNNLEEKTGNVDADFNESALKELKTGDNTLAIITRHNWRWGMLSMHVYNDGFGFMLDARVKKQ